MLFRSVPTPARSASSIELDPLTEGGLVAAQQVSMVDSLLVPQNAGAANNVVDFNQLKISAEASIVSFIEAQKLDDKLMLGAPAPSPLF